MLFCIIINTKSNLIVGNKNCSKVFTAFYQPFKGMGSTFLVPGCADFIKAFIKKAMFFQSWFKALKAFCRGCRDSVNRTGNVGDFFVTVLNKIFCRRITALLVFCNYSTDALENRVCRNSRQIGFNKIFKICRSISCRIYDNHSINGTEVCMRRIGHIKMTGKEDDIVTSCLNFFAESCKHRRKKRMGKAHIHSCIIIYYADKMGFFCGKSARCNVWLIAKFFCLIQNSLSGFFTQRPLPVQRFWNGWRRVACCFSNVVNSNHKANSSKKTPTWKEYGFPRSANLIMQETYRRNPQTWKNSF